MAFPVTYAPYFRRAERELFGTMVTQTISPLRQSVADVHSHCSIERIAEKVGLVFLSKARAQNQQFSLWGDKVNPLTISLKRNFTSFLT